MGVLFMGGGDIFEVGGGGLIRRYTVGIALNRTPGVLFIFGGQKWGSIRGGFIRVGVNRGHTVFEKKSHFWPFLAVFGTLRKIRSEDFP